MVVMKFGFSALNPTQSYSSPAVFTDRDRFELIDSNQLSND